MEKYGKGNSTSSFISFKNYWPLHEIGSSIAFLLVRAPLELTFNVHTFINIRKKIKNKKSKKVTTVLFRGRK